MPDAKTAQITFPVAPKAYFQRETLLRDRHWGWAVCAHVYENHPQGAEESYAVVFFFRGEKMVFVNGGPGDNTPIGSGYARSQCRDLGAPLVAVSKPRPEAAERAPLIRQPQSPFPQ
jgi:hypothetical protein